MARLWQVGVLAENAAASPLRSGCVLTRLSHMFLDLLLRCTDDDPRLQQQHRYVSVITPRPPTRQRSRALPQLNHQLTPHTCRSPAGVTRQQPGGAGAAHGSGSSSRPAAAAAATGGGLLPGFDHGFDFNAPPVKVVQRPDGPGGIPDVELYGLSIPGVGLLGVAAAGAFFGLKGMLAAAVLGETSDA